MDEEHRALFGSAAAAFETNHVATLTWLPPGNETRRRETFLFVNWGQNTRDWCKTLAGFQQQSPQSNVNTPLSMDALPLLPKWARNSAESVAFSGMVTVGDSVGKLGPTQSTSRDFMSGALLMSEEPSEVIVDVVSISSANDWFFDGAGEGLVGPEPVMCFALVSVFNAKYPSLGASRQIIALGANDLKDDLLGRALSSFRTFVEHRNSLKS